MYMYTRIYNNIVLMAAAPNYTLLWFHWLSPIRSVTTSAGSDQVSPGLIRDGTPCGDEMVRLQIAVYSYIITLK